MEIEELQPTPTRGRPRIPASEKKVPVSTTLDLATYTAIQEKKWQLNELILLGIKHREVCKTRDDMLLEMQDTIKMQERAIDKLNAKITEFGTTERVQ